MRDGALKREWGNGMCLGQQGSGLGGGESWVGVDGWFLPLLHQDGLAASILQTGGSWDGGGDRMKMRMGMRMGWVRQDWRYLRASPAPQTWTT